MSLPPPRASALRAMPTPVAAVCVALVAVLSVGACTRKAVVAHENVPERAAPPRDVSARNASFRDVTAEAGIAFVHHNGAGEGARAEKLLPETMGGGVAFFDYDCDGDADLLFVDSGVLPASKAGSGAAAAGSLLVLYANDGHGHFSDRTKQAGLDLPTGRGSYGQGVAVGDYDGDGWLDLYVTAVGPNLLLRNRGGRFEDATAAAGVGDGALWSSGAAFFDADGDGDLDLFVCSYLEWSPALDREPERLAKRTATFADGTRGLRYGLPQEYRGERPLFFVNRGPGPGGNVTFVERAREAGLVVVDPESGAPLTKALAVAPIDLEHDGRVDLLVTDDTMRNVLFHNLGQGADGIPRFEEVAELYGLAYNSAGGTTGAMGVDWGQLGAGKRLAVAVGNFAEEASSLYLAQDAPTLFADEALASGLANPTRQPLTFGVLLLDADLDGRLDLLQVNGHVESDIQRIDPSQRYAQSPQLFWNEGAAGRGSSKTLAQLVLADAAQVGDLARPMIGRGAAYADIDGDGDLDLVLTQTGGPPRLLRNDQATGHHWLRVRLEADAPNPYAYGASVELQVGGAVQRRQVIPSRGYLSQVEPVLTFGLGDATTVEPLQVVWPDGTEETFPVQHVDRTLVLKRGAGQQ